MSNTFFQGVEILFRPLCYGLGAGGTSPTPQDLIFQKVGQKRLRFQLFNEVIA